MQTTLAAMGFPKFDHSVMSFKLIGGVSVSTRGGIAVSLIVRDGGTSVPHCVFRNIRNIVGRLPNIGRYSIGVRRGTPRTGGKVGSSPSA